MLTEAQSVKIVVGVLDGLAHDRLKLDDAMNAHLGYLDASWKAIQLLKDSLNTVSNESGLEWPCPCLGER